MPFKLYFYNFLCQEQYSLGNLALGHVFDPSREEEGPVSTL